MNDNPDVGCISVVFLVMVSDHGTPTIHTRLVLMYEESGRLVVIVRSVAEQG